MDEGPNGREHDMTLVMRRRCARTRRAIEAGRKKPQPTPPATTRWERFKDALRLFFSV